MLEIRTAGPGIKTRYQPIRIWVLKRCANDVFSGYLEGLIMLDIIFNNKDQSGRKFQKAMEIGTSIG